MHYGPIYLAEMILIRLLKWTLPRSPSRIKRENSRRTNYPFLGSKGAARICKLGFLNKISKCGGNGSFFNHLFYVGKRRERTSFPALGKMAHSKKEHFSLVFEKVFCTNVRYAGLKKYGGGTVSSSVPICPPVKRGTCSY